MTQQPARLITPDGKTIELAPETYRRIRRLLQSGVDQRAPSDVDQVLRRTFGMLAGAPSLTQALLEERRLERKREDRKIFPPED
jgi:hypothetical protein